MEFKFCENIKRCLAVTLLILIAAFSSCYDNDERYPFSEKELDFVTYKEGQNLKFIDTIGITHTLIQNDYEREFNELVGLYGGIGFYEEYEVEYVRQGNNGIWLQVDLESFQSRLNIQLWDYQVNRIADPSNSNSEPLEINYKSLMIDGNKYNNVYSLKATKKWASKNSTDTATLFWNREYGAIQLLFPNGKVVNRVE